jgi:hypothetical protein
MSKQTAIQLLKENIDSEMKLGTKMVVNWDMYLAMEKEQIIEAYLTPLSNEYWFQKDEILNQESEKYYNETYNDKTIESYE